MSQATVVSKATFSTTDWTATYRVVRRSGEIISQGEALVCGDDRQEAWENVTGHVIWHEPKFDVRRGHRVEVVNLRRCN